MPHVKAFGVRDLKVWNAAGTTGVDLPAAQTLKVKPVIEKAELPGDDAVVDVHSVITKAEWELSAGGIPLEAASLFFGNALEEFDGATGSILRFSEGDEPPYVKIEGQVMAQSGSDVHVTIPKAIVEDWDGDFGNKAYYVSKAKGSAIDDGNLATGGIFWFTQNDTAVGIS